MLHCGGKFKPNEPRATKFQIADSTVDTVEACVDTAYADENSHAKAFSVRKTGSTILCILYGATGQRMGLSKSTDGTHFYNKDCFYRATDCIPSSGNFRIVVTSPDSRAGQNLYILNSGYRPAGLESAFSSDGGDGSIYHLRPDGTLIDNQGLQTGRQDSDGSDYNGPYQRNLYFADNSPVSSSVLIKCTIDANDDNSMACSGFPDLAGVFYVCGDGSASFLDGVSIEPSTPDVRTCGGGSFQVMAEFVD